MFNLLLLARYVLTVAAPIVVVQFGSKYLPGILLFDVQCVINMCSRFGLQPILINVS
jgi:hypothetical protein